VLNTEVREIRLGVFQSPHLLPGASITYIQHSPGPFVDRWNLIYYYGTLPRYRGDWGWTVRRIRFAQQGPFELVSYP
jgi:hypothetical protein